MSHPLELHNFVLAQLGKTEGSTVIDCGIGFGIWGYLMQVLRKPSLLAGIDVDKGYLLNAKRHRIYDHLIRASASYAPFRNAIFDYVLAMEVIEHVPKSDGKNLLLELERICRDKIILSTPNGYLKTDPSNSVESETHRSGWSAAELRSVGFRVHGISLRRSSTLRNRKNSTVYGFLNHVSTLVTFFLPALSEYLLATKELRTGR